MDVVHLARLLRPLPRLVSPAAAPPPPPRRRGAGPLPACLPPSSASPGAPGRAPARASQIPAALPTWPALLKPGTHPGTRRPP